MISDPKFSTAKAVLSLQGNVRLSEHWSLAFHAGETGSQGEVRPEPSGGIKLSWQGTPKIVRLSQDLEVGSPPPGAHFDVEVTLIIENPEVDADFVRRVEIQTESDTGPVRISLLTETIPGAEGGTFIILARGEAVPIGHKTPRLCIEISTSPKDLILRSVEGKLRRIDPTCSWKRLKEDKTAFGIDENTGPSAWALLPKFAADVAAAQLIAIRHLRSGLKHSTSPFMPLRVDRDSLLEGVSRTYDQWGLRQALARIYIHAETSDEQSRAIEALAKRTETDSRDAATCLYRLCYDMDPSSGRARKLAAKMFQNGDVGHASRLLKLTSEPDSSSTVIAHLRLAEALQAGIAIPPRNAVDARAQVDVAYVAAATLPFSTSGYAVRTHEMLRALGQQEISTICYARPGFPFDRPDAFDFEGLEPGELTLHGVRYCYSSVAPIIDEASSYIERLSSVLQKEFTSSRPAVVHAASNYMNSLPALIAARRAGAPFIYEVRGLWELTAATRRSAWEATDRFKLERDMETLVAREADHVLAITQGVADELVAGGVPSTKITLLPNAVDPELFGPRPADEKLAAELGIAGNFTLVYAGSLNEYEGLDDLITAIAELREQGTVVRLIVAGDGAASISLKKQVAELSLEAAVTFVGRVPPDDVRRYLSLADAVTLPRKAFKVCNVVSPLKPLEAMAMAKPVVLTDLPVLREIVKHDVTGLLAAPGSPRDLARTLTRLAADPDLRTRLGEAARRWVLQERSWSAAATVLKSIYGAVTNDANGERRTSA
jgi:glycosyltransferase involved in cell wall biosynthesis